MHSGSLHTQTTTSTCPLLALSSPKQQPCAPTAQLPSAKLTVPKHKPAPHQTLPSPTSRGGPWFTIACGPPPHAPGLFVFIL